MSMIADTHDIHCNCWHPFAHILASIFPPGHQDRNLTVQEILTRDYKEICRSGGEEERNHGTPTGTEHTGGVAGLKEEEEEYIRDEELQDLIGVGESAANTR